MTTALRPARAGDVEAIATVWEHGWRDGHLGHVPGELVAVRTPESFAERAAEGLPATTVAEVDGAVAGFVTVTGDEVAQVFVAAAHRGTGVAAALLTEGERRVAAGGHAVAWLAVVEGNARARRFYARRGWSDAGPLSYPATHPGGVIEVPCRRYVKTVSPA